jgi:hypothetical protein
MTSTALVISSSDDATKFICELSKVNPGYSKVVDVSRLAKDETRTFIEDVKYSGFDASETSPGKYCVFYYEKTRADLTADIMTKPFANTIRPKFRRQYTGPLRKLKASYTSQDIYGEEYITEWPDDLCILTDVLVERGFGIDVRGLKMKVSYSRSITVFEPIKCPA